MDITTLVVVLSLLLTVSFALNLFLFTLLVLAHKQHCKRIYDYNTNSSWDRQL